MVTIVHEADGVALGGVTFLISEEQAGKAM